MRADLLAEDGQLMERHAAIRDQIAALDVLLGVSRASDLGRRTLEALRSTETYKPPGINMTGLAKMLGINEGSDERKDLSAEMTALQVNKMVYRTAGGRYRVTKKAR